MSTTIEAPETELHRPAGRTEADPPPVILVPGAQASRLVDTAGQPVWPGRPVSFLNRNAFRRLSDPLAPGASADTETIIASDIIRGVLGKDFYGGMVESLEQRVCGPCVLPDAIGPDTRCILFPWDWRLDLMAAAGQLNRVIDRLRQARGEPDLKVDLVAHSAGGIVARYFIRFGGRDVLDTPPERVHVDFAGASKVRKAALIAVPNNGTHFGLRLMMRGDQVGLVKLHPELLTVMPGAYQVLPHPDQEWLIDNDGRPVGRDLYDIETWRELRQSIFDPESARRVRQGPGGECRLAALTEVFARGLERGRRMQLALSRPVPDPFAYEVFAGDCLPTPARFLEEHLDGQAYLRFSANDIASPKPGIDYASLMQSAGDGWVTRGSALGRESDPAPFDVHNIVFGCLDHARVATLDSVRNTLLGILALADAERQGTAAPSPAHQANRHRDEWHGSSVA
jgi:hypothetical protein